MTGTGQRPRHWVYLDDQRTHEVHAQVEPGTDDYRLAFTEFPAGSRDPAEAMTEERRLDTSDQVRRALAGLEQRLALAGTYYRADVTDLLAAPAQGDGRVRAEEMRWTPLQPPAGARKVDLRAFEVALPGATTPGARLAFHHFHAPAQGRDALLVQLPRSDLSVPRTILAQLDFDFPRVDEGDLKVLHARLAPGTLRSAVVRQHVDMPTRGYAKLIDPHDYERAFGSGWVDRAREVFRRAAARVFELAPPPPPPPVAGLHARIGADRLARAIEAPKLRALRDRYVAPGDAEALFRGGELAIRRFVQARRRRADHHTVYDLSVLESLLLVEYGLRSRQQALLDEEGAKLLRYVAPRSTA